MMTEDRDPLIQTLFAETQHDLQAETFVAEVMARTRFRRYRLLTPWAYGALALLTCVVFLVPLQELAILIARGPTITLIDLGQGWLAWVFSPVNNVAGLLVLGVKAWRIFRKKLVGAAYAN